MNLERLDGLQLGPAVDACAIRIHELLKEACATARVVHYWQPVSRRENDEAGQLWIQRHRNGPLHRLNPDSRTNEADLQCPFDLLPPYWEWRYRQDAGWYVGGVHDMLRWRRRALGLPEIAEVARLVHAREVVRGLDEAVREMPEIVRLGHHVEFNKLPNPVRQRYLALVVFALRQVERLLAEW